MRRYLMTAALAVGCSEGRVDFDGALGDEVRTAPADSETALASDAVAIPEESYLDEGYTAYESGPRTGGAEYEVHALVPADPEKPVVVKVQSWVGQSTWGGARCAVILSGRAAEADGCRKGFGCTLLAPRVLDRAGIEPCSSDLEARLPLALAADGRTATVAGVTARLTTPQINGPWEALPVEGAPPALLSPAAHFDGERVLVWGRTQDGTLAGSVYKIEDGTWTPVAAPFAAAASLPVQSAWTGDELAVLAADGQGAIFKPSTNTWRALKSAGAPAFTSGARQASFVVAASATDVYAWGVAFDQSDAGSVRGGIYDLATETWQGIDTNGAPIAAQFTQAVWTGAELVVWSHAREQGRGAYYPAGRAWRPLAGAEPLPPSVARKELELFADGGRIHAFSLPEKTSDGSASSLGDGLVFDVGNGTWKTHSLSCPTRSGVQAHARDGWLVAWGGLDLDPYNPTKAPELLASGYFCDLDSGRTLRFPGTKSTLAPRTRAAVVYTGRELFVWGGCAREYDGVCDALKADGALVELELPGRNAP